MNLKFDTSIIDSLIEGRVEPHIYAFLTNSAPRSLKIGDTYRPVSKRLNEWKKHFPDLIKTFEASALIDENNIFRDLQIHQFLITEKKLRALNSSEIEGYYSKEFFRNATTEHIGEAIIDIKKSHEQNNGKYKLYTSERLPQTFSYKRKDDYPLRPNQLKTVEEFRKAIQKGESSLLMYAVMRFGKSFTSMCCAVEINAKIVVVISGKADVSEEWKKTVETHVLFKDYIFLNKESLNTDYSIISKTINKGASVVLFLTLQDLQGDNIKQRHQEIFKAKIDLLIVDETHFGARAKEYGKVFEGLSLSKSELQNELKSYEISEDYINEIKKLDSKVKLHLSGTPYRILMGDEFNKNQIVAFYQFVDIVQDQKKWDEEHLALEEFNEWDNPYFGFPQMIRFAFHPNKSAKIKLEELKKNGTTFAFSELFRPLSIKKSAKGLHREFKYKNEILDLITVIDGTKEDDNLLGFLNYQKIKDGKLCRHIVCVLPYRASCDAFENLIKSNKNKFRNFQEYEIINIAGVEDEKTYSSTLNVKQKIKDCEKNGLKTLTLTVNRMLTGSTVEEWDTMLYFKDTASPQEYDQAIFRLQNQYVKVYRDNKENIIKYNMKPQTLLIDFDPNRLFLMQEKKALFYNVNVEDRGNLLLKDRIEKELKISPIIVLNKDKLVEVSASNIIDAVRNYSKNKSILDEAGDIPFDGQLLQIEEIKRFISTLNEIGSKRGLEIKPIEGEGTDLEIPPFKYENEKEEKNSPKKSKYIEEESLEKKLAAYYSRILFYAFLTKSKLFSLSQLINSIRDGNSENNRIAVNTGLNLYMLDLIFEKSSQFILTHLDCKIQNINSLGSETELSSIERAEVAMNKFKRVSESEVVMPKIVSEDLVKNIPLKYISNSTVILDISSKQAEIALAFYNKYNAEFPELKNNIFSITTSPIAYELTRKVYEALEIPLKNIFPSNLTSYDLIGDKKELFINQINNLNVDLIVGGPPYHKTDGGGRGDSGSAIYHNFFEISREINPKVIAMFLKANWYSGGKGIGLREFRNSILRDKRVSLLQDYPDPSQYFDSQLNLRGGVCNIFWERDYNDDCVVENNINRKTTRIKRPLQTLNEDILIRYNQAIKILVKIKNKDSVSIHKNVRPRNPFGIASNTNLIQANRQTNSLKVYLTKGKIGYLNNNKIEGLKNIDLINKWKVIVAKASPGMDTLPHSIISSPIVSEPGSLSTDSHLLIGVFESKKEASNFKSYMQTKLFRFMMLLAKNNQNMNRDVFRFVPRIDLNQPMDDKKLYNKFDLDQEDINFIDSVIREWIY